MLGRTPVLAASMLACAGCGSLPSPESEFLVTVAPDAAVERPAQAPEDAAAHAHAASDSSASVDHGAAPDAAPAVMSVTRFHSLTPETPGPLGFGKAVSAYSDGNSDFVLVGAPDASSGQGRVWLFQKSGADAAFRRLEIQQPAADVHAGHHFGAAVQLARGRLFVAAPGPESKVYVYAQSRDSRGVLIPGSGFSYESTRAASCDAIDYDEVARLLVTCSAAGSCLFWTLSANGTDVILVRTDDYPESLPGTRVYLQSPRRYGVLIGATGQADCAGEACLSIYDDYYDLAYETFHSFAPPEGTAFSGVAGLFDRLFVGTIGAADVPGTVLVYAKTDSQAWSPLAEETLRGDTAAFGTTMAASGDYLLVSEPDLDASTVHRWRIDRHASASVHDDEYNEMTDLGSSGPTYGAALDLSANMAVIGEPAADRVSVWPVDQEVEVHTFPADQEEVTVTFTQAGPASPPLTTVTDCADYRDALEAHEATCVRVTPQADYFGLLSVCLPKSPGQPGYEFALRCDPTSCRQAIRRKCCEHVVRGRESDEQWCVEASGDGDFVFSNVLADRDLDGEPDLTDNCPERPNPVQEDADGDDLGDVCDSLPGVAPAPVATPGWASLGMGSGLLGIAWALLARTGRRRRYALDAA